MASPVRRVYRSLGYAAEGLLAIAQSQPNFTIHLLAAGLAGALCFVLVPTPGEIAAIVLAIGLVLACEAFNTALETLADAVAPAHHPLVKRAKDAAAASVLLSASAAVGVGLIVFGPRLWNLLAKGA